MDAVVAEEVVVRLGGRQVLGPLSWRVGVGEHWALLGPNGSGKTTLLSLAGAERHPMGGRIAVLGEPIGRTDVRELRRRIGTVGHRVADRLPTQVKALEVVLTGRDSLLAPWWGRFEPADEVRARDALQQVRCGHLAEQAFGACSQGERQRVLVARSLFGRHELLLLDEPAVGVDLPGREALVGALDELARSVDSPTTVQVAHTLEELPASVTHALVLREGRAVAAGPADEVLTGETMSRAFGLPITVERSAGRFSGRASGHW